MKKKDDKDKEYKFFQRFLMLPLIPLIIFSVLMGKGNCESTTENWIVLVTSCVSSFATIILGWLVYFQTKKYRENDEQKEKKYREEQEKNREQELCLKANPLACFYKVQYFAFAPHPIDMQDSTITYNMLYEKNYQIPQNQIVDYGFQISLIFQPRGNNVVDYVIIHDVKLLCFDGNFGGDSYKEYLNIIFANFNLQKKFLFQEPNNLLSINFCLGCRNDVQRLQKIIEYIDSMRHQWQMTINYTLMNSFGVAVNMETECNFVIKRDVKIEFGHGCEVQETVVTSHQISEIYKEKTNELNT